MIYTMVFLVFSFKCLFIAILLQFTLYSPTKERVHYKKDGHEIFNVKSYSAIIQCLRMGEETLY
jgi:hypothetical protein